MFLLKFRNQKGEKGTQAMNGSTLTVAGPAFGGSSTSLLKQNGFSNSKIHPTVPAKMPKHIQMGTGFPPMTTTPVLSSNLTPLSSQQSQTNLNQVGGSEGMATVSQPDLLSDHARVSQHNTR